MIDPLTEPIDWDAEEEKRLQSSPYFLDDGLYLVEAGTYEEDFVTNREGEEVKVVRLPLQVLEAGFEDKQLRDTFWLSLAANWRIQQVAYAFGIPLKHTDGRSKVKKEIFEEVAGKKCKVTVSVERYETVDGGKRSRSTIQRYHTENFIPRAPLFTKPPEPTTDAPKGKKGGLFR